VGTPPAHRSLICIPSFGAARKVWRILGRPRCSLSLPHIFIAYVRFSRRLEQRADRVEIEAIADAGAYALSLTKLHQANCAPAVTPGRQTHPHLYDRLLAGGVSPDFPRPMAPSRSKPMLGVLVTAVAVIVLIFAMALGLAVAMRFLGYEETIKKEAARAEEPAQMRTDHAQL
jgi:hypothetical protein